MGNNPTRKNSSYLMQGMFLALASIISRIIGLIYRVPLTAIIGKTGNDNYGTAFSIYNILLIISSYSLPLAISKLVAVRMAEKRVKDAKRVLNLGLVFALISGGSAFLIVFFGADFFAGSLLKTENAAFALRVLSPALLIVAILGVLRGFFQGQGTMIPSAISQIIEQIINAIVSVIAALFLFNTGLKVSKVLAASYGAGGGTLGTVSGAFFALLFLTFVYFAYKKRFNKKLQSDVTKDSEKTSAMFLSLVFTIIPVLLSTTLYNISSIINQGIYKNLALSGGFSPEEISDYWGVFTGQVNVLINIPLAIANSIAASIVPSLASSYRRKEYIDVKGKVSVGIRFINFVSFPCMIGLIALASPIMMLLFNDEVVSSGYILMVASISVVFYAISTLTNGILQGIDKMRIPVIHAAISLVLQGILLVVLMKYTHLHIYAVSIANIFYALLMCILNGYSVKKYTKTSIPIIKTYLIPFVCSLLMGVGVFLLYNLLYIFSEINSLSLISAIIFGGFLYLLFMLLFKGITENDLRRMPKGEIIISVTKKLRLL